MNSQTPERSRRTRFLLAFIAVLLIGAYFRGDGLFRGLERNVIYHPDSPKQVLMLRSYLQGNYLQYYDSRYTDGYPFGLNRVDELLIRIAQNVIRPVQAWLDPDTPVPWMPTTAALFAWGRVLRVLYGLMVIGLIYAALRRFGAGPWTSLLGGSVYALAPLGSTVTHAVTGDIGVDLFLAVVVWSLAGYAGTGRRLWLMLGGFSVGMAYACKYQGGLGLWMPGLAILLGVQPGWAAVRTWCARGVMVISGFLVGMLAGSPAFYYDASKAWKNVRINYAFIKDFGAPAEILQLPLIKRIHYGLFNNVPLVLESVGWVLSLLALVALAHVLRAWWKAWRGPDEDQRRKLAAMAAIATFPVVAGLLSSALKPAVQPFHFSFLVPIMAVSVGLWLARPGVSGWRPFGCLILLGGLAFESWPVLRREHFMWSRPEATYEAFSQNARIFHRGSVANRFVQGPHRIKLFYNDPSPLAVFRNRASAIEHIDTEWWLSQHQLPVPDVPLMGETPWIFMNGPVFPRNDRMFHVTASGPGFTFRADEPSHQTKRKLTEAYQPEEGRTEEFMLVYHGPTRPLRIGLRTGHLPSRFRMEISGVRQQGVLLPHSQKIITLESVRADMAFPAYDHFPAANIVLLKAGAQLGPIWVTLLDTPEEVRNYQLFGPEVTRRTSDPMPDVDYLAFAGRFSDLRYLDGTNSVDLAAEPARLAGDIAPLAAGPYMFSAVLYNPGPDQQIDLELKDRAGHTDAATPYSGMASNGLSTLTWAFEKSFEPYDPLLMINAATTGVRVLSWRLQPDLGRMQGWLAAHRGALAMAKTPERWPTDFKVRYPGLGTLKSARWPSTIKRGEPFSFAVRFELDPDISHRDFHEASLFLHIKNADGVQVAALDMPLYQASLQSDTVNWKSAVLEAMIPPGRYTVDGGIYNGRMRIRYPFEDGEDVQANRKKKFFRMGELVID